MEEGYEGFVEIFNRKMMGVLLQFFWISVFFLIALFANFFFSRVAKDDCTQSGRSNSKEKDSNNHHQEEEEEQATRLLKQHEEEEKEENLNENSPGFSFKFEYQIPENINNLSIRNEEEESLLSKTSTNVSMYSFSSEKNLRSFSGQQQEAITFKIQESFLQRRPEPTSFDQSRRNVSANIEADLLNKRYSRLLMSADKFSDSDSESSISDDGYSVRELRVDSDSEGLLSEGELGSCEHESESTTTTDSTSISYNMYKLDFVRDFENFEEPKLLQTSSPSFDFKVEEVVHLPRTSVSSSAFEIELADAANEDGLVSNAKNTQAHESKHFNVYEENFESETYIESLKESVRQLEETLRSSGSLNSEKNAETQESNSAEFSKEAKGVEQYEEMKEKGNGEENDMDDLDADELDELESLWEHQDLIEQLRMELKKVRAVGLPTIFEESETETPTNIHDFQQLKKIDGSFLREDPIDELHKFYKSYLEKMRKLDILNYQKMYAIGFVQMKDPIESLGTQKPPRITTLLSQNFWLYRRKKASISTEPSETFIKELQCELETVYVGQTCLSWEFLRWQYEKTRDLPETDDRFRSHQYSQVAGEFQQFLVMLTRFVENESFQGPRVSNYVKTRCVHRSLLQVPLIKEDTVKDKKEKNETNSGDMLEELMEECISVFYDFVKADKDETPAIFKGFVSANSVELQDPSDYKLMAEAEQILLKKEKKLKDILRTGNCIVRKFKKPREDRSDQNLLFSQVDVKLVSRVLRMKRITTDQLLWCHKKLNKIRISDRKVFREPCFLLFPC